jgi:hypothetical protein
VCAGSGAGVFRFAGAVHFPAFQEQAWRIDLTAALLCPDVLL